MSKSKKLIKADFMENAINNSLIYQNTKSYYEYLRDMKSDNLDDACDYSTVFMTF